jgi:hypothetical protein
MDDDTKAQLAVLATLAERFASARMRFWLRGGWAVDFLLGEVTRRHGDIDLVTWLRHRRRICQVLTDAGFELIREWEAQTDFRARGQVVSIIYLTRLPDGRIITHSIPVWTWPDGSLSSGRKRLGTLSARVMSPEQLLREKESWGRPIDEGGTGRPPRPKDLESMRVLQDIIAER